MSDDRINILPPTLMTDVRQIIDNVRSNAVRSVDFCRVQMFWHLGQRIFEEEQFRAVIEKEKQRFLSAERREEACFHYAEAQKTTLEKEAFLSTNENSYDKIVSPIKSQRQDDNI